MEISFSQSALSDLEEIVAYNQEQDIPSVANKLVISIVEHIEILQEHPDIGRVVAEFSENHIRELIHPPYRIVYLRGSGQLQIIRIWQSERILESDQINEPPAFYKPPLAKEIE